MKTAQLLAIALAIFLAGPFTSLLARANKTGINRINPPTLYKTSAYTQVTTVPAGMKLIHVAGQTGRVLNPEGENTEENSNACAHPDMLGQYKATMDNVGKALAAGGATWDDLVTIRKFTTDMEAFLQASHSMPAYWSPENAPASTLIGVASLADPCFMVEIDVVAAVNTD